MRSGTDDIARYGGEEFVAILDDTDLAGAVATAERLRAGVAALGEPHAGTSRGLVTVSIGLVAFVPAFDKQPAAYLEVADSALYAAKRRGRNRVEVASGAAIAFTASPR